MYASILQKNATSMYPMSRDVLEVNPATGYIQAVAIIPEVSELQADIIIIAIAAFGFVLHLIFVIAYAMKSQWIRIAHVSGANPVRWIVAVTILSMTSIVSFQRLGLVDEYISMCLFGLIASSQLFNMIAEVIGSSLTSTVRGKMRYTRLRMDDRLFIHADRARAVFSIAVSFIAIIPLLIAYIVAYIRFVNVDRTKLKRHVYLYAVVPFVVLVLNVFWTMLMATRRIYPGTLYETGHIFAILVIACSVGFGVVFYSV